MVRPRPGVRGEVARMDRRWEAGEGAGEVSLRERLRAGPELFGQHRMREEGLPRSWREAASSSCRDPTTSLPWMPSGSGGGFVRDGDHAEQVEKVARFSAETGRGSSQ